MGFEVPKVSFGIGSGAYGGTSKGVSFGGVGTKHIGGAPQEGTEKHSNLALIQKLDSIDAGVVRPRVSGQYSCLGNNTDYYA